MIDFTILWLTDGPGVSTRTIGRDYVRRRDLTAAMTAASNMLRSGKGNSDYAHGFLVRKRREDD
jgi:hypothetical protein